MLTAGTAWALILFSLGITAIVVSVIMIYRINNGRYGDEAGWIVAIIIGAIVIIGAAIGTFPWQPQYHVMELHTGKIVRVEQRLVTDGSSKANITKELAFWMDGEREASYTDALRLTTPTEGQTLTVQRWDTWVYGGENYWKTVYVSAPVG